MEHKRNEGYVIVSSSHLTMSIHWPCYCTVNVYMLSVIFMIVHVCGLFEWKHSVQIFYCLFISVFSSEIYLSDWGIPLTGLTPPHCCTYPKPGPEFLMLYVMVLFVFNDSMLSFVLWRWPSWFLKWAVQWLFIWK